jgi:hypothetical protein
MSKLDVQQHLSSLSPTEEFYLLQGSEELLNDDDDDDVMEEDVLQNDFHIQNLKMEKTKWSNEEVRST